MSNGKESLKKSLGITEYPWSSDDEETSTPHAVVNAHLLRRTSDESGPSVADVPETSGGSLAQQLQSSTPTLTLKKNYSHHATMGPDILWPCLNYPRNQSTSSVTRSRLGDVPLSSVSRPLSGHTSAQNQRQRSGERRAPCADIQRILAFKKLTRSLNTMHQRNRSNSSFYAAGTSRGSTGAGSGRELIVTPPPVHITPEFFERYRRAYTCLNRSYPRRNRISPVGRSENQLSRNAAQASDSQAHAQLRASPPPPPPPPPADVDITHSDDDPQQNVSASGMSLEEEVVEIDAPDETDTNHNADIENEQVNANPAANTSAGDEGTQVHGVKRKRDVHEDTKLPYSVKDFNQSLLRLLECPVCLEWMEPPISQCRRGHLVCSRCRGRLASCPVCRTMFSSVRNRAMEGVAEMLRYPCRHGCGREVRLRRRTLHESNCAARHYQCPATACADRRPMPHDQLALHLQNKHLTQIRVGPKHQFSVKVNAEQHDNWIIMTMSEYFHLRVDVDIHTWGVVVFVAYIGPKSKSNNFMYEVIVDGQRNARRLVYSRETHSDLENSTLNVSRQDCFHLTLDQALNFVRFKNRHCEPDKFLDFSVEVTRNDVEVSTKDDSDS